MAKNYLKSRPIKIFFRFVTVFPMAFLVVLIVVMTTLTFFYTKTDNVAFFIAMLIVGVSMMALYTLYTLYILKQFKTVFIEGLYNTTIHNFENIARNENNFLSYPSRQYEEIAELNAHVDVLRKELIGATLIPNVNNFDDVELDYLDKDNSLVTFKSFARELENIIFRSQNYRNIIIEVYYNFEEEGPKWGRCC